MSLNLSEIVSLIGIFIVIGGAWLNSRISIAKLQTEVEYIKDQIQDEKSSNEKHFKTIYKKLDVIMDKLIEMK